MCNYHIIPNELADIIKTYNGKTIEEAKNDYTQDAWNTIDEYFSFLIKNEIIFYCEANELELFPKLSMRWDYPALITNGIIESTENNFFDYKQILEQLENIGCKEIQLFLYHKVNISIIDNILDLAKNFAFLNIDFFFEYQSDFNSKAYIKLFTKYPNLRNIYIYGAPENKSETGDFLLRNNLLLLKERIQGMRNCGNICQMYFSTTVGLFTESQLHNTCLNRKICIDADGEIKNCPSMSRSFGNIKDTTLKEAMEKPGFKDLWFICKDKIDVCKDCEFRHMCTDCRAFIKNPNNIYSQPAKCHYNPYIAKWKGEEGYVPVEECGSYTKEKGFVVNKRKVNKLNKEIWGEE